MKCKIIADIGWSHLGNMKLAEKMAQQAKECGADYVKFQTWSINDLKPGPWDNDGRREIYRKAEFTEEQHSYMKRFCDNVGIKFLTSIFNPKHISMVQALGCEEIKIPSTESINFSLLDKCICAFSNIYISTGGLTKKELKDLINYLYVSKANGITLLHCVSIYPCSMDKCNINRMEFIRSLFGVNVGYSDHTIGKQAAYVAISKGAVVVEKHFTTDQSLEGRDNKFACLPPTLLSICKFRDDYASLSIGEIDNRQREEEKIEEYRGRWIK